MDGVYQIDHYYDEKFMVGRKEQSDKYQTIWDKKHNQHLTGPYITSFIVYDYLYLITDNSDIIIMNIRTGKFINKVINRMFIYELHNKYVIYRYRNSLYRVCN